MRDGEQRRGVRASALWGSGKPRRPVLLGGQQLRGGHLPLRSQLSISL